MSKPMKPGCVAYGSVFISLLLLVGARDQVRADNTLEANGKHEDSIPGETYSTSTAQPAMLAINGGTITSTDNPITIFPPGGLIGLEAQGTNSLITAKNPGILGLGLGQTGISAVRAVNGGLVILEGGKIGIAGGSSIGLLADNGTVNVSNAVAISMTGPNSYGVEASGSGLVEISPGATITTSGIGGLGIFAQMVGTETANGLSIITSGLFSD